MHLSCNYTLDYKQWTHFQIVTMNKLDKHGANMRNTNIKKHQMLQVGKHIETFTKGDKNTRTREVLSSGYRSL